jgi:hypothetical protein
MKGLELARAYYERHGRPMIESGFADYANRMAVGLVGEGSECFGFDDEISTDHDFGPSFCIWLTDEDYSAIGAKLQQAYENLPGSFMGFPPRGTTPHSDGRVGVLSIGSFYRAQIGRPDAPESPMEWLRLPESRLAAVTNGEVFSDPLGAFSSVRERLRRFYPEDVRIKKIAARAAFMGQSGQYNYARCMRRAETVPALLALSDFIKSASSMVFLLNRKYAPFYKWGHRAMRDLPRLREVAPLLRELSLTGIDPEKWDGVGSPEFTQKLNADDMNVVLIEVVCALVARELRAEGLCLTNETFLAVHADEVMGRVRDERIRALHVMEG